MRFLLFALVALSLFGHAMSVFKMPSVKKRGPRNHQAHLDGLGSIQGTQCANHANVSAFYGIPYAKAPLGDLRFNAPVMWKEQFAFPYRPAMSPPPKCPQPRVSPFDKMNEDCLYLNIFTPKKANYSSIGVRVVFHGGWFYKGSISDPYLNGCDSVAETNTTLVVVQYRLGPLGFLAHPQTFSESMTTGNWGIMDQQLALRWVKKYIGYFGGNSSVSIFGQNAGAISVAIHMVSPQSKDLFTAAVGSNGAATKLKSQSQAYEATYHLANALTCPVDPGDQLGCLRAMPWQKLIKAVPLTKDMYRFKNQIFFPVVEGFIIPGQILDLMANGQINPATYMLVVNRDEGRTHVQASFPAGQYHDYPSLTQAHTVAFLGNLFPGVPPMQILHHYWIRQYANAYEQMAAIWTDVFINCPTFKTLTAMSNYVFPPFEPCASPSPFYMGKTLPCAIPLFLYYFAVRPLCPTTARYLGASSTRELPYFFNLGQGYTGCPQSKPTRRQAYDTTYAMGTLAHIGKPTWGNHTPWAMWTPEGQTAMVAEQPAPGLAYKTIDLAATCAVFEDLALPPPAAPRVAVLVPGAVDQGGGFPLGIGGKLPSPPPPSPPPPKSARRVGCVSIMVSASLSVVGVLLAVLLQ